MAKLGETNLKKNEILSVTLTFAPVAPKTIAVCLSLCTTHILSIKVPGTGDMTAFAGL